MIAAKPNSFCQKIGHFTTLVVVTIAMLLSLTVNPLAQGVEINVEIPVDLDNEQEVKTLPIRVVNEAGEPVAGVKIKPWALRSSQGHGTWNQKSKRKDLLAPVEVVTKADGTVDIAYPNFSNPSEKIKTLAVSFNADHPDYTFKTVHLDVPAKGGIREEILLEQGALVLIKPLLEGELAKQDDLYVITSGNRGLLKRSAREMNEAGLLRLPILEASKVAIRVVRIVDEQATHFGPLLVLDLKKGVTTQHTIELAPVLTVKGRLTCDNQVTYGKGRVNYTTLLSERSFPDAGWHGWAPVNADGTFSFTWPANESLQIIAMTQKMIATQGEAPKVVKNAPTPDPRERAHVFSPKELLETIEVPMRRLVPCEVLAVDDKGQPLEGIRVSACPNIHWWNSGSQIYCDFCIRPESILSSDESNYWNDFVPVAEFSQVTDAVGKVTLMLPEGSESISAGGKGYEMPIALGRRSVKVKLNIGETTKLKIVMQPRGQEQLGDWDKLAGIVFGCSTREGKRICALPGVKVKVAKFRDLLNEAENPRDPKILVEAYSYIVDVLTEAGDAEEASKWQSKVDEQKALLDS